MIGMVSMKIVTTFTKLFSIRRIYILNRIGINVQNFVKLVINLDYFFSSLTRSPHMRHRHCFTKVVSMHKFDDLAVIKSLTDP